MNRTEAQKKAIFFDSGDLCVTASAGSGKTSVMIERFIRLVLERKAEVKEVLAVTFTRLAAAEMKERLAKALREKLAEKQDIQYLKKQLGDLPAANISTVHSFCSSVIKRYFYLVGVEANFSIAEDETVEDLKNLAITSLFDDLYESDDSDFHYLLKIFAKGRKDARLKATVLDLYNYASSEEDEEVFLQRAVSLYTEQSHELLESELIGGFIERLEPYIARMEEYAELLSSTGEDKYIPYLKGVSGEFKKLSNEPSEENAKSFFGAKFVKPRKSAKDGELSDEVNEFIGSFKPVLDKMRSSFGDIFDEEYSERLKKTLSSGEVLKKLVDLTLKFKERFQTEKAEKGVLDYSDLEHKTFEILQNEEARNEVASSFKYIFVDEYQDTNGIQEAIFRLIARGNLFIVGDIKQSIYGFRGSDPTIFERRIAENETVDLKENFRSATAIVNAVNNVFCRVMSGGAACYRESPMVYGGLYPKEAGYAAIEYVQKDKKGAADGEDKLKGVYGVKKHLRHKKESLTCGRHSLVKKLIEENFGMPYFDRSGAERSVGYGDIMIVSRTNAYGDIVAELIRSGIPVTSEAEVSVAEYYEINLMADILTTVYTLAKDDIALISVLKSAVVSLKDEDLLKIRKAYKEGDFHTAVKAYSEEKSDPIALKLRGFYEYLKRIKLLSSAEGCGRLLRRIVEEKSVDLELLSMSCGRARLARLDRFLSGLKLGGEEITLAEFVEKKKLILERSTAAASGGEDSVRVMTIHKAKGLEAPVVIVVGLDHKIHAGHLQEGIYKNRKFGFGLDYYDIENKIKEPTVVKKYVAQENSRQALAEEARLLYVALTRAEVRLFVVTDSPLKDGATEASTLLDFLTADDMDYIVRDREEVVSATALVEREVVLPAPDERLKKEMEGYLDYAYPYEGDVTLSLKRTVTELNAKTVESEPIAPLSPVFATDIGDVEHGNAYHKFLELCSLGAASIDEDLEEMRSSGAMSEDELSLLDKDKLKRILSLDIFGRLSGYEKFREQPFIVNIPPELAGETGTSEILLQGVIDLLAVSGEEAIVVDYKFSIKDGEVLKERYKKQLELYSFAVEKVTGLKIVGKYLVNLLKEKVVEI